MKKILFLSALMAILFVQCGKTSDSDPYLIKEGAIGGVTTTTKIKELDSIFATDSLVKIHNSPNAIETQGEVEVYDTSGKKLLLLSPKNEIDPNSTITDILIHDARYKTEEGLSLESTFKDFTDHYTVGDIHRIINGVMVFFSDSDIYLTIDAKHLTEEARNDRQLELTAEHIDETAPIKYLRIGWESKN